MSSSSRTTTPLSRRMPVFLPRVCTVAVETEVMAAAADTGDWKNARRVKHRRHAGRAALSWVAIVVGGGRWVRGGGEDVGVWH